MSPAVEITSRDGIPATLSYPGARQFWLAVLLKGIGTGLGAAALTRLLEATQHLAWQGSATGSRKSWATEEISRNYCLFTSAVILMMELTGRDRSFILPLLVIVGTSTLVARSIEPRSIYDARLTDEQLEQRQKLREEVSR
jgi:H+/Cl- antiporter ClcA